MRKLILIFAAFVLTSCTGFTIYPPPWSNHLRTCPSSLPRDGATIEQAGLEWIQLANDLKGAERTYERFHKLYPDHDVVIRKRERLFDAIQKATVKRDELAAIMDRWQATGLRPAEWRAANEAYRDSLETALRRADAAYLAPPPPCADGRCGSTGSAWRVLLDYFKPGAP